MVACLRVCLSRTSVLRLPCRNSLSTSALLQAFHSAVNKMVCCILQMTLLNDIICFRNTSQGKAKKTRKFAQVKRLLNPKDARLCVPPPSFHETKGAYRLSGRRTSLSRKRKRRKRNRSRSTECSCIFAFMLLYY